MAPPLGKLLVVYAAVLTTAAGAFTVTRAVSQPKVEAFDTIQAQRINLREKDGTLRLVLSNRARFPGAGHKDAAGLVFFNQDGVESGQLAYGARRDAKGKVAGFGRLAFNEYRQGQVVSLEQQERDGRRTAGLTVSDTSAAGGRQRLFFGKSDGASRLVLRDPAGRQRLLMQVTPAGEASIQFLDADGRIVRTMTPTAG